jgi:mevalonate kinase
LLEFKVVVDGMRETKNLDAIAALAADFFVPARYVLATMVARMQVSGVDVEWRSALPIGSGLGSGPAASTAMVAAIMQASDSALPLDEVIFLAWQGDVIAHGGYGSSLDSCTCAYGGLISYTLAEQARRLPFTVALPLVIGDTLLGHSTSKINTHMRLWLQRHPARMHIFQDMGYLLSQFMPALEREDLATLGHLMNVHQLLQEKMGTSCHEVDQLIEAALGSGALGAKISGSGGGGIVIALVESGQERRVAAAIDAAGGQSYIVQTGEPGVRVESEAAWNAAAAFGRSGSAEKKED